MFLSTSPSQALTAGWTMELPKMLDRSENGMTAWIQSVLGKVQYPELSKQEKDVVRQYLEVQMGPAKNIVQRTLKSSSGLSPERVRKAFLAMVFVGLSGVLSLQMQDSNARAALSQTFNAVTHEAGKHVKTVKSPIAAFSLSSAAMR